MEPHRQLTGPLDEGVMVRLLFFETRIDKHGPEWCGKHLIGAMRRKAASDRFRNVALISDQSGKTFQEVLKSTEQRLALFCSLCGRCEMARKPVE